jgi:hypothetical protein
MADDDKTRNDPGDKPPEVDVYSGGLTGAAAMHDAIIRQVSELLADSDLSEEEKQRILASIACPCCGGAGPSLVIDLNKPSGGPVY